MKKNVLFLILAVVLVLGFVSCSDSIESAVMARNGNKSHSVTFSNGKSSDGGAKSVVAADLSLNLYGVSNCYWAYTAEMIGNPSAVGTQTSKKTTLTDSYGLGTIGGFESGEWTFVLYAYKEATLNTLLYRSKPITKTLQLDTNYTVNFPVSKLKDGAVGKGGIKIFTSGTDAIRLKDTEGINPKFFVLSEASYICCDNDANGSISETADGLFSVSDLTPGTYDVVLKFTYEGAYYTACPRVEVYSNFDTELIGDLDIRHNEIYSISYYDKGGSALSGVFESTSPTQHEYGTVTKIPNVEKDYYDFDGWSTSTDCSVNTNRSYRIAASVYTNTDLYAKWTPVEYPISYNYDATSSLDFIAPSNPASYTYEDPVITLNNPSRIGFDFKGWTGTALETATDYVVIPEKSNGQRNYTATWYEHKYSVHFDSNCSNATVTDIDFADVRYTEEKSLIDRYYERTNYNFIGWAKTSTTSVEYTTASTVSRLTDTDAGTVTLYAKWNPNGHTKYKVEHYCENIPDTNFTLAYTDNFENGDSGQESYATPRALEGFTLDSANTNKLDTAIMSDTDYGTVFKLYYKRNVHTLTWNFNGGSATGSYTTNGNYKYEHEIVSPTVLKDGYTFTGWDVTPPEKMPADSNVACKAQWEANSYKIVFHGHGGLVGEDATVEQNMTYDVALNLKNNEFTKIGYSFKYWTTEENGTGTVYDDEFEVKNLTTASNGVVNLYAQWTGDSYTVVFNGNGSTGGSMESMEMTYDSPQSLNGNAFEKTGYHFAFWSTNEDGTGTTFTDMQVVNNLTTEKFGVVNLYVQWEANSYKIVFNGNKGSGSSEVIGSTPEMSRMYDDTPVALSDNGFSRIGYTFGNWNTIAAGTGQSYTGGQVCNNLTTGTSDVNLYAQWVPKTYTITLRNNGGGKADGSVTATFDAALPSFTALTAVNAVVEGYYTTQNPSDGIKVIDADGNFVVASGYTDSNKKWVTDTDVTLYAAWVTDTTPSDWNVAASTDVTLDFTCNGKYVASYSSFTAAVSQGAEKVDFSTPTSLVPTSYTSIEGFYTNRDCTVKVLEGSGKVVSGTVAGYVKEDKWACSQGAVTLYAKWKLD